MSYWGLSSKAPKPPLDRFRVRCNPLVEAAYLTHENVCFASLSFFFFWNHRFSGNQLLSNKKQEKVKLSRGSWNKWVVRERLVGLCRESPFTALLSEATFAVTDDFLNLVRVGKASEKPARAALLSGLLNIMELWDALQPLKINKTSNGVR